MTASPARLVAEPHAACVVCGMANPQGLKITYQGERDGSVTALWTPSPAWEGFRGIIHGGIVSTVLDEAMSKAVQLASRSAVTGELRVRFRRHVASGEALRIRAWIRESHKRLLRTEAALVAADNSEHAHAWATFVILPWSCRG